MHSPRTFRRTLLRQLLFASGVSFSIMASAACGSEELCFQPAQGAACPDAENAVGPLSQKIACDEEIKSVDGPPELVSGECCYPVTIEMLDGCVVDGRPFVQDAQAVMSEAVARRDWFASTEQPPSSLSGAARKELAAAWTERARAEHASIASFNRFSMELMAAGAPPNLLEQTQRAAADEIRHAAEAFSLAARYAGAPVGPGPLPLDERIALRGDLMSLAVSTAVEACVNETLAVLVASEELAAASDPMVVRALTAVVEDESRHAALAWQTVAWAIRQGGEDVRAAVEQAILAARPKRATAAEASHSKALEAHGVIGAEAAHRTKVVGFDEVVLPSMLALMGQQKAEAKGAVSQRY